MLRCTPSDTDGCTAVVIAWVGRGRSIPGASLVQYGRTGELERQGGAAGERAGPAGTGTPSTGEGELVRVRLGRQGPSSRGAYRETSTLQRSEDVAEAGVVDAELTA
jgi:hypothetical protein